MEKPAYETGSHFFSFHARVATQLDTLKSRSDIFYSGMRGDSLVNIIDFHITGEFPNWKVEAELQESQESNSQKSSKEEKSSSDKGSSSSIRLEIGSWNYVSLLNEKQLKSLIRLVHETQKHQPTEAMKKLKGTSLKGASASELP